MASERQARPRLRRLATDARLRAVVLELLDKRWSPEQMAHELPARFPGEPDRHLCVEPIYQAIYDPGSTRRETIETGAASASGDSKALRRLKSLFSLPPTRSHKADQTTS